MTQPSAEQRERAQAALQKRSAQRRREIDEALLWAITDARGRLALSHIIHDLGAEPLFDELMRVAPRKAAQLKSEHYDELALREELKGRPAAMDEDTDE